MTLVLYNDRIEKFICSHCWDAAKYDDGRPEPVNGEIKFVMPKPPAANNNKQQTEQEQYENTPTNANIIYLMYG
jgi:hypothetical protein